MFERTPIHQEESPYRYRGRRNEIGHTQIRHKTRPAIDAHLIVIGGESARYAMVEAAVRVRAGYALIVKGRASLIVMRVEGWD